MTPKFLIGNKKAIITKTIDNKIKQFNIFLFLYKKPEILCFVLYPKTKKQKSIARLSNTNSNIIVNGKKFKFTRKLNLVLVGPNSKNLSKNQSNLPYPWTQIFGFCAPIKLMKIEITNTILIKLDLKNCFAKTKGNAKKGIANKKNLGPKAQTLVVIVEEIYIAKAINTIKQNIISFLKRFFFIAKIRQINPISKIGQKINNPSKGNIVSSNIVVMFGMIW